MIPRTWPFQRPSNPAGVSKRRRRFASSSQVDPVSLGCRVALRISSPRNHEESPGRPSASGAFACARRGAEPRAIHQPPSNWFRFVPVPSLPGSVAVDTVTRYGGAPRRMERLRADRSAAIPVPVGAGLVGSLARPGANVTGVAFEATPEQAPKRLELFKELALSVKRVGIFGAPRPSRVL